MVWRAEEPPTGRRPEDVDAERLAVGRHERVGGGPRHGGQGRVGGEPEIVPARRLHGDEAPGVGVEDGVEHLVARDPCLDEQPSSAGAPAHEPGRPGQHGDGL